MSDDGKVVRLADAAPEDNRRLTVLDTLQSAFDDVAIGEEFANRCVVILLDDTDDKFSATTYYANISRPQIVSLLEHAKFRSLMVLRGFSDARD